MTAPSSGRSTTRRAACAVVTIVAASAAPAVRAAWLDAPLSAATWGVLAALGLAALALGVATLRRPRRDAPAREETGQPSVEHHFIGGLPAIDEPPAPPNAVAGHAADLAAAAEAPARRAELPAAIRTRRAFAAPRGPGGPQAASETGPAEAHDGDGDRVASHDGIADHDGAVHAGERDDRGAAQAGEPVPPADGVAAAEGASQLFASLQHVDVSIDVLRRHLAGETRPMPAVWIMLLDLARTHGRDAAFREIAAEFHRRFNVSAPEWDGYPPGRGDPGLEAYPRIVKELTLSWGTQECRRLLDRLLFDNRGGGRRGFSVNAYNDLIALRRAAEAVLDTIDQDGAEETKLRRAYARAAASNDAIAGDAPAEAASPLVRELESQLEGDLRRDTAASALEREHPALVDALAREWRTAGLAGRLAEMLARTRGAGSPLSGEAREDVELLHDLAQRLAAAKALAAD